MNSKHSKEKHYLPKSVGSRGEPSQRVSSPREVPTPRKVTGVGAAQPMHLSLEAAAKDQAGRLGRFSFFFSRKKKKKKKEAVETGKIRPPPNLDKVRATGIFFVVVVPQS